MDKLEQYLDQVCRSIGGPRSLRQHVRQELREHLRDAAAEHKAAGLSEEQALARALEDFGKPEDVRTELEATHGHRLMGVVIDKAMQWKEMTMKAKWLWLSWTHLALVAVIVLEVLFITFNVLFIIPKFQKLMMDGIIDPAIVDDEGAAWMVSFLHRLSYLTDKYTTFMLLAAIVAWGLFEWRVRSEHKTLIRLSMLGTAAAGLMIIVIIMSGSLVIAFTLGAPAMGRISHPFALQQVAAVDTSVSALEQALAKKDWGAMAEPVERASKALKLLANASPAIPSLTDRSDPKQVNALREHVKAANESLLEAQRAIGARDATKLEAALEKFRREYAAVQEAAKKTPQ